MRPLLFWSRRGQVPDVHRTGTPRPSPHARLFVTMLALALVVMACGGGESSTVLGPTATATPDPGRYDGTWLDDAGTPTTGDVGELVITHSGHVANIHAYGDCGTICDWGTQSGTIGTVGSDPLVAAYVIENVHTVSLTLQPRGAELKVLEEDANSSTNFMMHRGSAVELRAFLYVGLWDNTDPSSTDIASVEVGVTGVTMTVQAYGACTPNPCDLGSRSGTYSGDPFTIVFDFGNGTTNTLSLRLADGVGTTMQIVDVGSKSGTVTDYMAKQTALV